MPLFRKKKTIWQIQELEGYLGKVIESQVPPDYEINSFEKTHQALDSLIRPNWESLHLICQDFIYSWFIEYHTAKEQKQQLQSEFSTVNNEMNSTKQKVTLKLDALNKEDQTVQSKLMNVENVLNQKVELIEELTHAIENKTVGEDQLKSRMEQRVKSMNERMIKQQEKFEASQIKIGNQFKTRTIELDEEKLVLSETFEKNKETLRNLEEENNNLKKRNQILKNFQNRLTFINSIIKSISPNLLKGEES